MHKKQAWGDDKSPASAPKYVSVERLQLGQAGHARKAEVRFYPTEMDQQCLFREIPIDLVILPLMADSLYGKSQLLTADDLSSTFGIYGDSRSAAPSDDTHTFPQSAKRSAETSVTHNGFVLWNGTPPSGAWQAE